MDWIQGDKFITLADWTYSPSVKKDGDYDNLPNTLDPRKIKDGDIVYTHNLYVKQLFDVISGIDKKLIVVSHNSDVNIDFSPPVNVIKWFTQNVDIYHKSITPIPIGLENSRWFPGMHKKEKMIAKLKEPRRYKNLLYINHNVATNPAKREGIYEFFTGKPWVTIERGTNGSNFDNYLDNIYNHKFVLCPEGNGIDTHRIWETLYMGSIPVVERNITSDLLYSYFPCLTTMSGWTGITEGVLKREFFYIDEIKEWYTKTAEMLTFEYWKNKIISYKK